jgi:hypothetical protein
MTGHPLYRYYRYFSNSLILLFFTLDPFLAQSVHLIPARSSKGDIMKTLCTLLLLTLSCSVFAGCAEANGTSVKTIASVSTTSEATKQK